MKKGIGVLIIAMVMTTAATAFADGPADDSAVDLDRRATTNSGALKQRAEEVFRGVFAQCRDVDAEKANGATVSIVFEVQSDGSFGATATFRAGDASKRAVRQLATCMGSRANHAAKFPSPGAKQFVGAKFTLDVEEKNGTPRLILGEGDSELLDASRLFTWGRGQS